MKLTKVCVFGFAYIKNDRGGISTKPLSVDWDGECENVVLKGNQYGSTETLVGIIPATPMMFKVYGSDDETVDPVYLGFESPDSFHLDWEDEFNKTKQYMQVQFRQKSEVI